MGTLRVICIMSSYQTPTPSNVIILVISKNQAQNAFLSKLAFYSLNSYFHRANKCILWNLSNYLEYDYFNQIYYNFLL